MLIFPLHLPGPPPGAPLPAPHVNLAFFLPSAHSNVLTSDSQGPPPTDPCGRPSPYHKDDYRPPGRGIDRARVLLSEAEFEEIMTRNRVVLSSAVPRAVSDASVGDYGRASETLVTAISLIKQSKVSDDDHCKVVTRSLQDCMVEVNPSLMVLDPDMYNRERDQCRSQEESWLPNLQVESIAMTITEREAGGE